MSATGGHTRPATAATSAPVHLRQASLGDAPASPDARRIAESAIVCINVPVAFYEPCIRSVFSPRRAPVYVLPEVRTVQQVFGVNHFTIAKGSAHLD